jgi:hypothetical protein
LLCNYLGFDKYYYLNLFLKDTPLKALHYPCVQIRKEKRKRLRYIFVAPITLGHRSII